MRSSHLMLQMCRDVPTCLVLLFAALFWFDTPAAAAPCPPGWTLTPAGNYCEPPGCSEHIAVPCTGRCSFCGSGRGGPRPGEKAPPCTADGCPQAVGGNPDFICHCCLRKVNCGVGSGTVPKPKGSLPSPGALQKLPKADPCPPTCEVNPDTEVQSPFSSRSAPRQQEHTQPGTSTLEEAKPEADVPSSVAKPKATLGKRRKPCGEGFYRASDGQCYPVLR
jgi:hypothetical protein